MCSQTKMTLWLLTQGLVWNFGWQRDKAYVSGTMASTATSYQKIECRDSNFDRLRLGHIIRTVED